MGIPGGQQRGQIPGAHPLIGKVESLRMASVHVPACKSTDLQLSTQSPNPNLGLNSEQTDLKDQHGRIQE